MYPRLEPVEPDMSAMGSHRHISQALKECQAGQMYLCLLCSLPHNT
jgi:hypothetical protein